MKQDFIENELIIFTKQTFDVFLGADNPADLIALYSFYYYTAKWQKTNMPKCTTAYVAKGLNWSADRVRRVKKQLVDFGLIEDICSKDDNGKINGHYIHLTYVFKRETVEQIVVQEPECVENHTMENPECGKAHSVGSSETNALSTGKENALSTGKENALSTGKEKKASKDSFNEILLAYTTDNETLELLKEWLKVRKAKRAGMTDTAIKLNLDKLNGLAKESNMTVNAYLKEVICRGWAVFYAIRSYQNTSNTKNKSKSTYHDSDEVNLDAYF